MNFDLTAEQRLLQATSQAWFAKHFRPSDMRHLLDDEASMGDRKEQLAQTGYLGALVSADQGGGGLSLLELALICEQAGRVLADVPLVATAAYAVGILVNVGERARTLLGQISSAGEHAAVAEAASASFNRAKSTLTARCAPALGAQLATSVLVLSEEGAEPWVALVESNARGVVCETHAAIDPTRRIANVRCEDASATLLSEGEAACRGIEAGRRKALVALAAEGLGAASACVEESVAYAKERYAFGRPIGSFQAIKHMCVDSYMAVEQLRTLVWYAAWCEEGEPSSFGLAASAARAYAADTLEQCAETLIQVHGGVGVTWEHDAHLYWRRAQVDKVILGDSSLHRANVARAALSVATSQPASRLGPAADVASLSLG